MNRPRRAPTARRPPKRKSLRRLAATRGRPARATRRLPVELTESDLQLGLRCDHEACPLALAINRSLHRAGFAGHRTFVGCEDRGTVWFFGWDDQADQPGYCGSARLSDAIVNRLCAYDAGYRKCLRPGLEFELTWRVWSRWR